MEKTPCTLDADIHGSLPQSRQRWFVLGLRKDNLKGATLPAELAPVPMLSLSALLDSIQKGEPDIPLDNTCYGNLDAAIRKIEDKGHDPFSMADGKIWVLDLCGSRVSMKQGKTMTLTASRCSGKGYYVLPLLRWLTLPELLRLQGMNFSGGKKLEFGTLGKGKIGHMVGNAIPVTLLMRLFAVLLPHISSQSFATPWD